MIRPSLKDHKYTAAMLKLKTKTHVISQDLHIQIFVKSKCRAVKMASKSGCPEDNHFSKYSCPHRIFGCPHTKKECWLPSNIIKCLVYFVVPMNTAVHVMCFYYSS